MLVKKLVLLAEAGMADSLTGIGSPRIKFGWRFRVIFDVFVLIFI